MKFSMLTAIIVAAVLTVSARETRFFDLVDVFEKNNVTVVHRTVAIGTDPEKRSLVLSEEAEEGLVWIDGVSFSTGTIEIDLKGQDVFQHSFLGIAFHGLNDSTFDAVYFRPFQFLTADSVRRTRGVQYISLPEFPWQRLRAERHGVFEKTVAPPPDPNGWFHATIVVRAEDVTVFVNHSPVHVLQVPLLGNRRGGKIALYTADRSGGSFARLVVTNE